MTDLDTDRIEAAFATLSALAPFVEPRQVVAVDLGTFRYRDAFALQDRLQEARQRLEIGDLLLFVEHNPVYTYGKRSDMHHLLLDEAGLAERGIDLVPVDRGGDITWHGPGQLVVYPILDLNDYRRDLHWYMRTLEETIIRLLRGYGLQGERREKMTGVWVQDANLGRLGKVCAMGVRVSRWVTKHGLALNIQADLSGFTGIVPCGLHGQAVTTLATLVEPAPTRPAVIQRLADAFGIEFKAAVSPVGKLAATDQGEPHV